MTVGNISPDIVLTADSASQVVMNRCISVHGSLFNRLVRRAKGGVGHFDHRISRSREISELFSTINRVVYTTYTIMMTSTRSTSPEAASNSTYGP